MRRLISVFLTLGLYLGCYKGYIALWETGMAEPLRQYSYPVSSLPPADQKALAEGIPVGDALELAQRLEDFLS